MYRCVGLRSSDVPRSSPKSQWYWSSPAGPSSLPVAVNLHVERRRARTSCRRDASTVGAAPPGSVTVTSTSSVVVVPSLSVAVTVTVCTPASVNVQSNDDPSTVPSPTVQR